MVGLSRKRVFPKTKGDSITGQDRAQKHCDFRFSQIEKKSKVAVLQLPLSIQICKNITVIDLQFIIKTLKGWFKTETQAQYTSGQDFQKPVGMVNY